MKTGVAAIYDRYSYDAEKRRSLVRWGQRLEEILTGAGRDNVTRIA